MARYVALLIVPIVGCSPYVPPPASEAPHTVPENVLQAPTYDMVTAMINDTSGSFQDKLFGAHPIGYEFFLRVADGLHRHRFGADFSDQMIIGQISTSPQVLLWQGTPRSLTRRFGSSSDLAEFIASKGGGGSPLYQGIADALSYCYNLPGVAEGKTKLCVLILSDMCDTSNSAEDKQRMQDELAKLRNINAEVAFYFVEHRRALGEVRNILIDAGYDPPMVYADIVQDPPLPVFGDSE